MSSDQFERLIAVLEAENTALKTAPDGHSPTFASEKARALADLQMRASAGWKPGIEHRDQVRSVKTLLSENAALLQAHIRATNALAERHTAILRSENSDGTYSRRSVLGTSQ